ncbi:hypothetical protein [Chryseobacterium antibioticum]|uniref:hypothetical protein n=1 Tax=Chryseobacterium antibioticum TaxID=2728847 RepID=UPI00145E1D5A|nr:hypothetical protein [Chryseobacterium antibioticum]
MDFKSTNQTYGLKVHSGLVKNQRLRSYDEASIREILDYRSKNKLTNTETGNHFKISRNTIARWRSFFKS